MDLDGNIVERYNYDAWGRRRNPDTWEYTNVAEPTLIDFGYTGHSLSRCGGKHWDELNLINMTGRTYDPHLAHFLSPDPYVQMPGNTQNLNRYSYALNNPLVYTDPDGELVWFVPVAVGAVVGGYIGASTTAENGFNLNPNEWGKDWYKAAAIGAIVGAGAGAGFSAAFAPGALGGSSFAVTGMSTAAGNSTIGWSIASSALQFGNINMATTALAGGSQNEILQAGLKGLATGAAIGGLAAWSPNHIGGYLLKRNAANNIDWAMGDDDLKLSAGLIGYNVSENRFRHIAQKGLSSMERGEMVYETFGMMRYIPKHPSLTRPTIRANVCNGRRKFGFHYGKKTTHFDYTKIVNFAESVYDNSVLRAVYHENQIISKYATQKANQPTIERGLDRAYGWFDNIFSY